MRIKNGSVLLAASLGWVCSAYCAETNENVELFGITVTQKAPAAEDQFARGHAYFTGEGPEQDFEKAAACFRKSAELGHALAQFNLGICYMNGVGVTQSEKEAVQWLKRAAHQGVKEAFYPLGLSYYNLEQYTEAYAWALLAEADGDSRLKEMLHPMYSEEEITTANIRFEALKKEMTEKSEATVAPDSNPEN